MYRFYFKGTYTGKGKCKVLCYHYKQFWGGIEKEVDGKTPFDVSGGV